jgi:hypothetical protein
MSFKNAVAKLAAAAAAVAVAGVAGTAWADDISMGPVEMGVSFLVETNDTARIEVAVKKSPNRSDLEKAGLAGADAAGNNPGSLGILKVTTNSDKWDVKMKTMYGGKLVSVGESTPDTINLECPAGYVLQTSGWNNGRCDSSGVKVVDKVPGVKLGNTQSLVYNGKSLSIASNGYEQGVIEADASANDTVMLVVKIGMCDLGADLHTSATPSLFYSWGEPDDGTDYEPVLLDSTKLRATRKHEFDGSLFALQTAISFADAIGGSGWTGAPLNGQPAFNMITATSPFKKPVTSVGSKHVQHFYVNVGLNPATGVGFLEKKANN